MTRDEDKIARDTTPGIDTVHHQLLKHIHDESMVLLLYILITLG